MLIWSGRGILSVLVFMISMFICVSLFSKEGSDYTFVVSFITTGLFSWFFGNMWNTGQRVLIDKQTGKKVVFKNQHTLFWIPMQYIGYIFISIGIAILFQNSILFGVISIIIPGVLISKDFFSANPKKQKEQGEKIIKETKILKEEEQELPEINEAESIRIKKEKEDPNRFMPKS
jgi:hypothetical protein